LYDPTITVLGFLGFLGSFAQVARDVNYHFTRL
jgi:hypothetical protein